MLINVIGYAGDIAEESRDFRRQTTFRRGELRRAVADVLRRAERTLTTLEVAQSVYATKGLEVPYARKCKPRVSTVRKVLKCLERAGRVCRKTGSEGLAVWLV